MPRRAHAAVLVPLLLMGCATPEPGRDQLAEDAAWGGAVASILGTPFYAVFKATSCLVTTAIVVPSSAAIALTDRPSRVGEREALHAGLGRNCFGSYLLYPS